MRILLALLALLLPNVAAAQRSPVVVELYTSQGCSACPPADAVLAELAQRPDVVALALHVDYWDYLGWKDTFGDLAHTERQRAYSKRAGKRSVYTPQMIVQGVDRVIGSKHAQVMDLVAAHQARPSPVALDIARESGLLRIRIAPTGADGAGPSDVVLVRFLQGETVTIDAGENAGQSIPYTNPVTDWSHIGVWDGVSVAEFAVELSGTERAAVIVQRERLGPVLSAANLR